MSDGVTSLVSSLPIILAMEACLTLLTSFLDGPSAPLVVSQSLTGKMTQLSLTASRHRSARLLMHPRKVTSSKPSPPLVLSFGESLEESSSDSFLPPAPVEDATQVLLPAQE